MVITNKKEFEQSESYEDKLIYAERAQYYFNYNYDALHFTTNFRVSLGIGLVIGAVILLILLLLLKVDWVASAFVAAILFFIAFGVSYILLKRNDLKNWLIDTDFMSYDDYKKYEYLVPYEKEKTKNN